MTEKVPYICYECDSEFFVFPTHTDDDEVDVAFCPYCGSEIENLQEDDDYMEDDYLEEE